VTGCGTQASLLRAQPGGRSPGVAAPGRDRPLRVLHCPDNVGGHPAALARAERAVGLDSVAVTLDASPFGYMVDETLWDHRDPRVRREVARWRLLWRAVRAYDIVHFNFGSTILPSCAGARSGPGTSARGLPARVAWAAYRRLLWLRDLPLLRRLGKGIVVTYQGDDVRQGDWSERHGRLRVADLEPGYYTASSDRARRIAVRRFDRYAHRIYALNPDLLHVLPAKATFLPYASVDPRTWTPSNGPHERPPVVLHAPTHRGIKGTRYVLDAVRRLRDEGVAFDFVLVEGLRHDEARRLYARSDLLVDQLLVGWYGGLAVECMALGKPVICYIREEDLGFLPDGMRADLPIIRATPATLADVLRLWLTSRRLELPRVGRHSRAYVERWHDPIQIATRLKGMYETVAAELHERRRR
jgi:glycosyltransferase involved in cell wall biosynthesis